ncbi:MAG: hypothetical protein K6E53_02365 [Lachnospiraceae bacterium]|nr:hypothetical protein [Lachnospiraceae bacterium]
MVKKNDSYTEVMIEHNGRDIGRNPLTKQFQYEYALYLLISNLFHSVRCRSRNIESLMLYFMELPEKVKRNKDEEEYQPRTKKEFLSELTPVIARDVFGHITFPKMHECAAEVVIEKEEDGTHTFIFTDGIYGFALRLQRIKHNRPLKIRVTDLSIPAEKEKEDTVTEAEMKAVLKCAA